MPTTMGKKKKSDRHKPSSLIRVPRAMVEHLRRLAEEEIGTSVSEHVRAAVREYLQRKGKLPRPGEQP